MQISELFAQGYREYGGPIGAGPDDPHGQIRRVVGAAFGREGIEILDESFTTGPIEECNLAEYIPPRARRNLYFWWCLGRKT